MFKQTTTITRLDRDRLVEVAQAKENTVSWAMFIRELQRQLDRARIVESARVPRNTVTMHSTVGLRDLSTDRCEILTLVYPEETDLSTGKLSVLSPIGTALSGAFTGEIIEVLRATGPRFIRLESILHQPEAEQRGRQPGARLEGVA